MVVLFSESLYKNRLSSKKVLLLLYQYSCFKNVDIERIVCIFCK